MPRAISRIITRILLLLTVCALVPCVFAGTVLTANYWAEGSTDASGTYTYNGPGATQLGSAVIGYIPTNGNQQYPDSNVVNYFRTGTYIAGAGGAYNGALLGNLTGYSGLTATFSLNNSALAAGQQFDSSQLVGELISGQTSNAGLRLMFMGGSTVPPGATPNQWWSNPGVVYVTSMKNGQDVTLTVDFDPALWSNYYGHRGTESSTTIAQFEDALANVTRLGLSFGSGYFYSDGFSFNTGGTAYIELDSIGTTGGGSSTPEPASFALLLGSIVPIAAVRWFKKRR